MITARKFAKQMHEGQMYGQEPYYVHLQEVTRMAMKIIPADVDDNFRSEVNKVCWLHDSLEDTTATRYALNQLFGGPVCMGVSLVTKVASESRSLYIARICDRALLEPVPNLAGKLALVCKIADSMCNLKRTLNQPKPNLRRVAKYTSNLSTMIPVAKQLGLLKPEYFL